MSLRKWVAIGLTLLTVESVHGETLSPKYDGLFYYRIGGGRTFTSAPKLQVTNIDLVFKASVTGLSCGKFDPRISLSNSLNRVKDGVEDAYVQLENAASAAISALPGYILQSIDPGLYDLFMNSIFRAEEQFSLATKSCEKMSSELAKGKNPFEDMVTASVGDTWKASAGVGGVDIVNVKKAAASTAARNNGVNWIGGERAGGNDDPPLWLTTDVAQAGYNILLDRDPENDTPVDVDEDSPPLAQRFDDPDKVKAWLRAVFGDVFVGICESCESGSVSGQGMRVLIESEKDAVADKLQDLYDGSTPPTLANLEEASAPDVFVTRQVIEVLQGMEATDASIFLSKLTDEIAISRVINDALLVKQTLQTGKNEANVRALDASVEDTEKTVAAIDAEIESILNEARIKKELLSSTLSEVLIKGRAENTVSRGIEKLPPKDKFPLDRGVIKVE